MPFIQPTGVPLKPHPTASGSNSVASLVRSFSNDEVNLNKNKKSNKKAEPEPICQVKNNWVESSNGPIHIFTKTWQPLTKTPVQSVIVFVHDIMEHCERYQPLFAFLASKGIEVQSFDMPGFGETAAKAEAHGTTGGYNALLREIDSAIGRASDAHPQKPLFLMGHGMGGALVLNYVCGLGERITFLAGVISSSPYLKPTILGAGARFPSTYNRLGRWYPNVNIGFQVTPEELTRDLAEQERYHGDGLIRDSVSLQCLGDLIYQGNKMLVKRWKKFPAPLPMLLLHGTDDPICSYKATAALNTQLLKLNPQSLKFTSWKGNKHDPHWDIDANAVKAEYVSWIRSNTRHFEKLPLEPSMVHSDMIKSARSKSAAKSLKCTSSNSSMDHSTEETGSPKSTKEKEKTTKKLSKAEKKKLEKEEQAQTAASSSTAEPKSTSGDSTKITAEQIPQPEESIQDLQGLLRQQQMRVEKAKEKRREYGLELDDEANTSKRAPPTTVAVAAVAAEVSAGTDGPGDIADIPTEMASSTGENCEGDKGEKDDRVDKVDMEGAEDKESKGNMVNIKPSDEEHKADKHDKDERVDKVDMEGAEDKESKGNMETIKPIDEEHEEDKEDKDDRVDKVDMEGAQDKESKESKESMDNIKPDDEVQAEAVEEAIKEEEKVDHISSEPYPILTDNGNKRETELTPSSTTLTTPITAFEEIAATATVAIKESASALSLAPHIKSGLQALDEAVTDDDIHQDNASAAGEALLTEEIHETVTMPLIVAAVENESGKGGCSAPDILLKAAENTDTASDVVERTAPVS